MIAALTTCAWSEQEADSTHDPGFTIPWRAEAFQRSGAGKMQQTPEDHLHLFVPLECPQHSQKLNESNNRNARTIDEQ
jgi:hypothetical protein